MSDIQEQLRKIEYVPPDAKDAPLGLYDKKELEALIQEQVRLARSNELRIVPTDCLDEMQDAIQSIIRTEKLELLAEVSERVVGENDYQPGNPAPDLVEHNQLVRDGLRFEQRVELNKLEAEL